MSTAVAICAPLPRPAFATINGCPPLAVPPSSVLLFGGYPTTLAGGPDGASPACVDPELKQRGIMPGTRPDVEDGIRRDVSARALNSAKITTTTTK